MALKPPAPYLPSTAPIRQMPGGLIGWAIIKKGEFADSDGNPITNFDKAFWEAIIAKNGAGDLFLMARVDCTYIKGSIGEPNFNETTSGNCQVPVIQNGTIEFTVTDEAEDANFSGFNPYEHLRWNWNSYSKDYVAVFFNKDGSMFAGRDHTDENLPIVGYSIHTIRAIDSIGEVDTDVPSHQLTVTHKFDRTEYSVKPVPTGILEVLSDDLHAKVA